MDKLNDFISDLKKASDSLLSDLKTQTEAFNLELIEKLNRALATELVCILRYRRHYYVVAGLTSKSIGQELLDHANEELQHADMLAERIIQLGGTPDFNPATLSARSSSNYTEGLTTQDILQDNLIAELSAIHVYKGLLSWVGNFDPTTHLLIENILKVEEEHADDLRTLLDIKH